MAGKQRMVHGRLYEHPEHDGSFGIFLTAQHFTLSEWRMLQERARILSSAHMHTIDIARVEPNLIIKPTNDLCFAVLINRHPTRQAFEAIVAKLLSDCRLETNWPVIIPGDEELLCAMLIWELLQED